MTIRHLSIFQAVCECDCNSTKAAEQLHMTQPAVSLAIKELEEYYGIKLFDRIGRRLKITEAGKNLLQYAGHILSLFQDMETGLRNWDSKGMLRIGSSITIGAQFLPGYVKTFTTLHSGITINACVQPSEVIERRLLNNELDFALVEGVPHDSNIVSIPYMTDVLSVICSAEGPWENNQVITPEEFLKHPVLLREPGSGTREIFDGVMALHGFSVTPIWEAESTTALINAVINGIGVAVLPHRMILPALRNNDIHIVKIQGMEFQREFKIIYHKDKYLTPSARAFIDLVEHFEENYPLPTYHSIV